MPKATLMILIVGGILASAGCVSHSTPSQTWVPPQPASAPTPDATFLPKIVEAEMPLPTAVETTLMLQEKYSRCLEDLQRERDHNRDLTDEKRRVIENLTKLQTELDKTRQELGEANNLLVQVRQELDKWKGDVLGFRDEMRQANKSQIDALAKVMNLLGAEVNPAPADGAVPVKGVPTPPAAPKTPAAATKGTPATTTPVPAVSIRATTDGKENVANAQRR
jgi:hypothetical protein